MFLSEALKYNVPAFHEDRLTQIVAATFNSSKYFQRIFFEFLKVRPKGKSFEARTQVANNKYFSRPDLIILVDDFPLVLVESKVEARADKAQQKRHSRMKCRHNFLFVRDPVHEKGIEKSFVKVTWFDFFSFLQGKSKENNNSLDRFLINELVAYGRESSMLMPDKILKSELENAAKFLTQMRLRKFPSVGFQTHSPFKALDNISTFFERVLLKLKEDVYFAKNAKVFTRQVKVSSLYVLDLNKKAGRSDETLYLKSNSITIEKEIVLKKKIKGFSKLFLRLEFLPCHKGKEVSDLSAKKIMDLPMASISYKPEVLAGLSDAQGSFNYSDCVLFEDKDFASFSRFYGEAMKHWRRSLG